MFPMLAQLCLYGRVCRWLVNMLLALVCGRMLPLGRGPIRISWVKGLQHRAQLAGFCLGVELHPSLLQNPRLDALQEWAQSIHCGDGSPPLWHWACAPSPGRWLRLVLRKPHQVGRNCGAGRGRSGARWQRIAGPCCGMSAHQRCGPFPRCWQTQTPLPLAAQPACDAGTASAGWCGCLLPCLPESACAI